MRAASRFRADCGHQRTHAARQDALRHSRTPSGPLLSPFCAHCCRLGCSGSFAVEPLAVLLTDRRPLTGPVATPDRRKCCGGLLSSDAQKVIGQMGLGLPQSVLVTPQLFMVRAIVLASGLERHYQRFYLNMDRERFDRWLLTLMPPSVDLRDETHLAGYRETSRGFELSLRRKQHSYTETAGVLVGADGANSSIRRSLLLLGADHRPPAYLAVQEWYHAEQPLPC